MSSGVKCPDLRATVAVAPKSRSKCWTFGSMQCHLDPHHGTVEKRAGAGTRVASGRWGFLLLGLTLSGLLVGGLLHWAGPVCREPDVDRRRRGRHGSGPAWDGGGSSGPSARRRRHRPVGPGRRRAVGEYLAGAVIAVMVASGQALEAWAAGQARRELGRCCSGRRRRRTATRTGPRRRRPRRWWLPATSCWWRPARSCRSTARSSPTRPCSTSRRSPASRCRSSGRGRPGAQRCGQRRSPAWTSGPRPVPPRAPMPAIVRLVTEAEGSQAPVVRLADRYAVWFLGVTLVTAAVAWALGGASRAVAVLVVATPCPLILAAPVALVSGLSRAAKRGVIVKGGAVLERLATLHDPAHRQDRDHDRGPPGADRRRRAAGSLPARPRSSSWPPRSTRCPRTSWPAPWSEPPSTRDVSSCCPTRSRRCPARASGEWSTAAGWRWERRRGRA